MKKFEEVNQQFKEQYGLELFIKEEPYLMAKKKPARWVGIKDSSHALLKRNGDFTTKYPKSYGIIDNGGHRPISLNTLLFNIKEGRPLFGQI